MPQTLNEQPTADAYDAITVNADGVHAPATFGPSAGVRQIQFSVLNQAVFAQFWNYIPGQPGKSELEQLERVYLGGQIGVIATQVAGVRFRSKTPGQPGLILGDMALETDPQVNGGTITPVTSGGGGVVTVVSQGPRDVTEQPWFVEFPVAQDVDVISQPARDLGKVRVFDGVDTLLIGSDGAAETLLWRRNQASRSDVFGGAGAGVTVAPAAAPFLHYSLQVVNTGGAATWDIRLEGSVDGTTFGQLAKLTDADGSGAIASVVAPVMAFRARAAGVTGGTVTAYIIGTP